MGSDFEGHPPAADPDGADDPSPLWILVVSYAAGGLAAGAAIEALDGFDAGLLGTLWRGLVIGLVMLVVRVIADRRSLAQ